jgi:serine protease Do
MFRRLRFPVLLLSIASCGPFAFAGDKFVNLETIPSGATVEVNGSVTCTTPCQLKVAGYYFGAKRTAFSRHGIEPIIVRFTKDGYLPRQVNITAGPIRWTSLNGVNAFEYYIVRQESFNIQLEAEKKFFPAPVTPPATSLPEIRSASVVSVGSHASLSTEEVVQASMPSVVVVSTSDGWGSGFLISPQGVVVTNAHVIGNAQSVKVSLNNGQTFNTAAIYKDDDKDLALVKVPGADLPFLSIADTLPQAGADVIAIGSPGLGTMALTNTVTKGIVSAVRQSGEDTWIQTDVSINRGNSGGPLLNSNGRVVGVNTLAAKKSEYSGLNFAISTEELAGIVEQHFGVSLHPTNTNAAQGGSMTVSSVPPGADVEIDGVFIGSTPSEVPVQVGDRRVKVSKKGFKTYERTVRVIAGAKQSVSAELEPEAK